ncbi:hypothetical protein [Maribacter sp. 2304DJ31-5]|uniref:hypothetical protein n=1 Tax=Maribacter sp. 2304DJ31-5 TaxID=3386273 RepID=UPI0039BC6D8C
MRSGLFNTIALFLFISGCNQNHKSGITGAFDLNQTQIPTIFSDLISSIAIDDLGDTKPELNYELVDQNTLKVVLSFDLKDSIKQDDWGVKIKPAFDPDFYWSPHLAPEDNYVISQHAFRAPALIMADTVASKRIVMVPDVELIEENGPNWYMDIDALKNVMSVGWSKTNVKEHVLFTKEKGAVYAPGNYTLGFYLKATNEKEYVKNPWRDILAFQWENYGKDLYRAKEPLGRTDLEPYAEHTYNWAFDTWEDAVWQEFEIEGQKVGAPAFIVNVTQSPNYPEQSYEREFRSIWNQAWFSSLRSASGLYRYARRTQNEELLKKAVLTKELALSFPQKEGFFSGLIATEMEEFEIEGETYTKSKGWDTYYFGNSNRNPYVEVQNPASDGNYYWGSPKKSPYHILDMSWTAYLMLTWYEELEKDERLLQYATRYADALLKIQDDKGYFPGWISDDLKALGVLDQSPESAMSVTFLLKAYKHTKNEAYKEAALKCMGVLLEEIVPVGRWEDYETYWSCSGYGKNTLINKKVARNDMYKQNTLSIYWTAESLFDAYKLTNNPKYLEQGQRTLDELLMAQASWQPPFMYIRTLGGFGVMNADGEWNDSRQSLFAELIIKYGKELNKEEYIERGLAALRSSFVMMYCPENPITKVQWEAAHPHFGPEDYGFMMENYAHNGVTSREGLGIGVFTIYDWGNGAATEAYNKIRDHYGEAFIEQ